MRPQRLLPRKGARENVILFTVSGFRFAIAASAVSEIRSMAGLDQFSMKGASAGHKVGAKLDYTLQRHGITIFVVDAARHFHLPSSRPSRVLVLRHTAAALLVDSTDRMMEISVLHSLPLAFHGEERSWYRGLAILNGETLPVVNPEAFLSRGEVAVLRALILDRLAQPLSAEKKQEVAL